MTDCSSPGEARQGDASALRGVLTSVGFWVCLLIAAIGFAGATLSTSFVKHQRLSARLAAADAEVRELAEQVDRYERCCRQLAEPATPAPASDPSSNVMPVEASLQFRLDGVPAPVPPDSAVVAAPSVIEWLSRSPNVRRVMMVLSAGLMILAFTVLQESREPRYRNVQRVSAPEKRRPWYRLADRYRAATDSSTNR